MNRTSVKIAALTPVTMAAVGLTQLHYLVSHFATIAELTAAVTVGTAIWVGKGRKGRQEEAERAAEPVTDVPYTVRSLPPVRPVAYPMSEEVAQHRIQR